MELVVGAVYALLAIAIAVDSYQGGFDGTSAIVMSALWPVYVALISAVFLSMVVNDAGDWLADKIESL